MNKSEIHYEAFRNYVDAKVQLVHEVMRDRNMSPNCYEGNISKAFLNLVDKNRLLERASWEMKEEREYAKKLLEHQTLEKQNAQQ
jgi:hypothetical protein